MTERTGRPITGRPRGTKPWHMKWHDRQTCSHGPDGERQPRCEQCMAHYAREYHKRRWESDPTYRADYERRRLVRALQPEKRREDARTARFRLHGITLDQYHAKFEAQNECCAICGRWMAHPHIDHDHATGKHRGLLCGDCNRGLGQFRDRPERCRAAALYLEKWQ